MYLCISVDYGSHNETYIGIISGLVRQATATLIKRKRRMFEGSRMFIKRNKVRLNEYGYISKTKRC